MDGRHGTSKLPDGRVHQYTYDFDAKKCVLGNRSILENKEGREESGRDIRYYTLSELDLILKETGFSITQTYGDYDNSLYHVKSRRMILISDKLDFLQTRLTNAEIWLSRFLPAPSREIVDRNLYFLFDMVARSYNVVSFPACGTINIPNSHMMKRS